MSFDGWMRAVSDGSRSGRVARQSPPTPGQDLASAPLGTSTISRLRAITAACRPTSWPAGRQLVSQPLYLPLDWLAAIHLCV
jgi:hypothetical protein